MPFFSISGSDFIEMFVGLGTARMRDLFEQATNLAPCLVVMDELDALGKARGAGRLSGHNERKQTRNQLLVAERLSRRKPSNLRNSSNSSADGPTKLSRPPRGRVSPPQVRIARELAQNSLAIPGVSERTAQDHPTQGALLHIRNISS